MPGYRNGPLVDRDEPVQSNEGVWHWSMCQALADYGDHGPTMDEGDCNCEQEAAERIANDPSDWPAA